MVVVMTSSKYQNVKIECDPILTTTQGGGAVNKYFFDFLAKLDNFCGDGVDIG